MLPVHFVIELLFVCKLLTPNTNPPTRCLCLCNWVEFPPLSDRSTYQYNYSGVNHVERKRQRVHLFAFFFFKGILYSVLFMMPSVLQSQVCCASLSCHQFIFSVLLHCLLSCTWSQKYLIGLLTQLSLCNSPPLFSQERVPNSMAGSK